MASELMPEEEWDSEREEHIVNPDYEKTWPLLEAIKACDHIRAVCGRALAENPRITFQ